MSFLKAMKDVYTQPFDQTPQERRWYNPYALTNRQQWTKTTLALIAVPVTKAAGAKIQEKVEEKTGSPALGLAAQVAAGIAIGYGFVLAARRIA